MDNMCRTCMRVPSNLTSLYADPSLITKIEAIASVQINEGADYPSNICQECIHNVNTLYNFRKVIINSDKELRERSATLQRIKNNPLQNITLPRVKNKPPPENEIKNERPEPGGDLEQPPKSEHSITDTVNSAISIMKICECKICHKTFPSRFKLDSHKRREHVKPGVCNVCGVVVRNDNLKKHIQLHFSQPIKCKECGRMLKNLESLRGHMLYHRGITYTCEICGRVSKVKAEHKRHVRGHEDPTIGRSMCTICGKRVRNMATHMHSHTGERPHTCVYCMKSFTSTYSLKVHTRQHTNEKPYICEYCSLAFPQKVSLVTHIKSKHNS